MLSFKVLSSSFVPTGGIRTALSQSLACSEDTALSLACSDGVICFSVFPTGAETLKHRLARPTQNALFWFLVALARHH